MKASPVKIDANITKFTPLLEPFSLTLNDTVHTVDQWKAVVMHALGLSGHVAVIASLKAGKLLTDIGSAPAKPIEPKQEFLKELNDEYRADGKDEDKSLYFFLRKYQTDMVTYEEASREYARKFNESDALIAANKAAAPFIIAYISDTSQAHIKRTAEGMKAFDEYDAVRIFTLAWQSHDKPDAGDEATAAKIQLARSRLTSVRQGGRDFDTYLAELDNSFAHLLACDPSADAFYSEVSKVKLLDERSDQSIRDWFKVRRNAGTLKATYAGVCADLKSANIIERNQEATAKLIREGAVLGDHAAHATSSAEDAKGAKPKKKSVKVPCAYHLGIKQERIAQTHTTEDCRELKAVIAREPAETRGEKKSAAEQKRDAPKKIKSSKSKGDRSSLRVSEASAHAACADGDSSDSDYSISNICVHSAAPDSDLTYFRISAVAQDDDTLIYFDNCAEISTVRDVCICNSIATGDHTTRLSGVVSGPKISTNTHGMLGPFGRQPVSPDFDKNLLAQCTAEAAGYETFLEGPAGSKTYYLRKRGHPEIAFQKNGRQTYSTTFRAFKTALSEFYGPPESKSSVCAAALHSPLRAVDVLPRIAPTAPQRERMALVKHLHETSLCHLGFAKFLQGLRGGLYVNSPVTPFDVQRYMSFSEPPCERCARIKGTRPRATGHYLHRDETPGAHIAGDIFYLFGKPVLLTSCALIRMKIGVPLKGKSAGALAEAIRKIIAKWHGLGQTPKTLSIDREPAVMALAAELKRVDGITVVPTPPEGHEKLAEREGRTIKEHFYATLDSIPVPMPFRAVWGIFADVIKTQNASPNTSTAPESPNSILTGERLDLAKWSAFAAGDFGIFSKPYSSKSPDPERGQLGFIIGHGENYQPKALLLPGGTIEVMRDRRFVKVTPTDAHYAMLEALCTGDERIIYRDSKLALQRELGVSEAAPKPAAEYRREPLLERIERRVVEPTLDPTTAKGPAAVAGSDTSPVTPPLVPLEPPAPVVQTAPPLPSLPLPARAPESPALHAPLQETALSTTPAEQPTARPRRAAAARSAVPGFYREGGPPRSTANAVDQESSNDDDAYFGVYNLNHQKAREQFGPLQEMAGVSEIINIFGRNGLQGVDGRKLSGAVRSAAVPSFMFYKEKALTPEEAATKPTSDWSEVPSKREAKQRRLELKYNCKVKGRLVLGGHRQKGIDKNDLSAPTARSASHKILFNLSAKEKRHITVGDVPAAYLQTDRASLQNEDIYTVLDKECARLAVLAYPSLEELLMPDGRLYCKVLSAVYGLKESGAIWYMDIRDFAEDLGYTCLDSDLGVFIKRKGKGSVIASLHVDDLMTHATDDQEGRYLDREFWAALEQRFPGIKIQRGPTYSHLGHEIFHDRANGVVYLSQAKAIRKMLKHHGVEGTATSPHRSDLFTSRDAESCLLAPGDHAIFRSALQQVAYFVGTRPELAATVSLLQRHSSAPSKQDFDDLEHLFRYLNAFPDWQLKFAPKDLQLRAYADGSYAGHVDQRSQFGFFCTVGGFDNAPFDVGTGTIKTILRSSTETEGYSVNEVISHLYWARDFLHELGYKQEAIPIREDNTSCITLMQRAPRNFQTQSKHIRIKWKFFRQQHKRGVFYLEYCPTDEMRADILTKALAGKHFRKHAIGLHNCSPAQ